MSDRSRTLVQAACAACFSLAFVLLAYYNVSIHVPAAPSMGDRLAFTLRWLLLPMLTVSVGVFSVMKGRFNTAAIDPLAGAEDRDQRINARVLQNTVEQVLIHALGLLVLSTYLPAEMLRLIPILCVLFVIGRCAFWVGYHQRNNVYRVFGFAVTMIPMDVIVIYLVYRTIAGS